LKTHGMPSGRSTRTLLLDTSPLRPGRRSVEQDREANAASAGNAVRVKVSPELARVFDVQRIGAHAMGG